jgi:WD40 repeat protein
MPVDKEPELVEPEAVEETTYGVHEAQGAAAAGGVTGELGVFPLMSKGAAPRCLAFAANDATALAAVHEVIHVVDLRASKKIGKLSRHRAPVRCLTLSPQGDRVLSGDKSGDVLLWEVAGGETVRRWQAHRRAVEAVAFSPSGRLGATGGADGRTWLWDLDTGKEYELLEAHWREAATCVAFSPDGRLLAAGSEKGHVGLWSVKTGEPVHHFRVKGPVDALAFNPGLDLLLVGSAEAAAVWRWRLKTGEAMRTFRLPNVEVTAMVAVPDGHRFATIGFGGDAGHESGREDADIVLEGPLGIPEIPGVDLVHVAGHLAIAVSDAFGPHEELPSGHCLRLWNVTTGNLVHSFPCRGEPDCLAVTPNGSRAITAADDGKIRLWGL